MSSDRSILGLLLGTAVGVGLGVIFAPDKGSKTRQLIAQNANAAKDAVITEAEKFKSTVATEAERLKHTVSTKADEVRNTVSDTLATKKETLDDRIEGIVNDSTYKADDVISKLEHKLRILKAKNKKVQTKTEPTIK
ncbi:MAG TPA: YtxH domain-containing protein [Flavobacteriaceae bacterium]|nr:YtxH domain-containing protein [Flavobacteriaceae bacterium]